MKIKTVVRERINIKKNLKNRKDRVMFAVLLLSESVINTFLPFLAGFYLATTQRLFWFIPFIILLIFNVRIEYNKGMIQVKITRNFWR